MKYKVAILAVLAIMMLVLTGCFGNSSSSNSKRDKFYQGSEGVDTKLEGGTPPSRMYYDAQTENEFDIDVSVHNRGPSYTRGAVFVSGFDPDMIEFEGMNIREYTYRNCYFDLDSFGQGGWAYFGCKDFYGVSFDASGGSNGYWNLGVGLENLLEKVGINVDIFDVEFSGHKDDGLQGLKINWDNIIDVDAVLHGQQLISIAPFGATLGDLGEVFILKPDNHEFPGGDMDYLNFHGEIVNWPIGLDETDQTFLITTCYLYETYAAPLVCIDPDPYSTSRKVCTPQTVSYSGGQGAPLAVTSVEMEPTPNKVFFTIHLANIGGGTIYNHWELDKCSPYSQGRTLTSDLNHVELAYVRIGQDILKCVPNDHKVRLDEDGRGQITCEYDIRYNTARSAYKTPLIIALWYGYEEHTQKSVHFKRIG